MKKQPLRIGFDLDGVLLYNPARIIRPMVVFIKKFLLHKKSLEFYYPQSPISQWMWKQFHKSSIFIAPGIDDVKKLIRQKKIQAYLITARYSFLGPELMNWIKKNRFDSIFTRVYYNEKNEQPHLFKEKMITKCNLDFYIEDNWDIVNYLSSSKKLKCSVYWIYNIFDKGISYVNKYPYLSKAIQIIKNETKK